MSDTTRVVWSADGETFNHESLGEAIDDLAVDEDVRPGRVVYFGKRVTPRSVFVTAEDTIEAIANAAYDDGGEWAEDFPQVSAEAKAELDAFLRGWQEKHCKPTWWRVSGVQEYVITAADLEDAA